MEEYSMTPMRRGQHWLPYVFNDLFDNNWMVKANSTAPAINVIESEDEYRVEVAAPGMTKEDFTIKIDDNDNLVVTMEKKEEYTEREPSGQSSQNEQGGESGESGQGEQSESDNQNAQDGQSQQKKKEGRYLRREFSYSKFQQTMVLPENVDKDKIEAKVENGVLNIIIPKRTEEEARQSEKTIEIK